MTYGVANKNYRMFRNSFFVVALVTILVLMCIGARFALGYDVPWEIVLVLALLIAGATALFFSTARWYNEREDIRAAWLQRINNIDTFLFLAHGPLKAEGVRVIRHLWTSDSAQHVSMFWSKEQVEGAARSFQEGELQFFRYLYRLQARGFLEISQKSYHRLSIGENLWDVVRAACPLDKFSANSNDDRSVEETRQKLDTLCGS
ncbi:MAG: hypothetical protein AMXMBFR44_2190 [Candidatus Campbellbacteria bacterium]